MTYNLPELIARYEHDSHLFDRDRTFFDGLSSRHYLFAIHCRRAAYSGILHHQELHRDQPVVLLIEEENTSTSYINISPRMDNSPSKNALYLGVKFN